MRVILARNAHAATKFATENRPDATVEAEYGDMIIEGTVVTLAHHGGKFQHELPPSARTDVPVLPEGSTILISHIDPDTIGGVAALMGYKPNHHSFWQAIGMLDDKGPHYLHQIKDPNVLRLVKAYMAFWLKHMYYPTTDVVDVTLEVNEHIRVLKQILVEGNDSFIKRLLKSWDEHEAAIEQCLIQEEVGTTRVFISDGPFCNGAYYSPSLQKMIPAIITWKPETGAITVSFMDGGKRFSAREIVQSIWGPLAGGHDGIAGSPRGLKIETREDLNKVIALVQKRLRGK